MKRPAAWLVAFAACFGLVACGTTPSKEVHLVPDLYGGFYLERDVVHHRQLNVHTLEFQTFTGHETIYLDQLAPVIDGEHIRVGHGGPEVPRPQGTIKLDASTVTIQLRVAHLKKDGYEYREYEFNGTFPLIRNDRSPLSH